TMFAARHPINDIVHTPFVLFSETRPDRRTLAVGAVQTHPLDRSRRISIIIPTKDRIELLQACIDSITEKTAYPRDKYEIVIVNNGSIEPSTIAYLEQGQLNGSFLVLDDNEKFNYARLNN